MAGVSDRERLLLLAMQEAGASPERCFTFAGLANLGALERLHIRRTVRALARKGLALYQRGLWTEDGEPAGSGYGLTEAGIAAAKAASGA